MLCFRIEFKHFVTLNFLSHSFVWFTCAACTPHLFPFIYFLGLCLLLVMICDCDLLMSTAFPYQFVCVKAFWSQNFFLIYHSQMEENERRGDFVWKAMQKLTINHHISLLFYWNERIVIYIDTLNRRKIIDFKQPSDV